MAYSTLSHPASTNHSQIMSSCNQQQYQLSKSVPSPETHGTSGTYPHQIYPSHSASTYHTNLNTMTPMPTSVRPMPTSVAPGSLFQPTFPTHTSSTVGDYPQMVLRLLTYLYPPTSSACALSSTSPAGATSRDTITCYSGTDIIGQAIRQLRWQHYRIQDILQLSSTGFVVELFSNVLVLMML